MRIDVGQDAGIPVEASSPKERVGSVVRDSHEVGATPIKATPPFICKHGPRSLGGTG
jgi:hypothetical protein